MSCHARAAAVGVRVAPARGSEDSEAGDGRTAAEGDGRGAGPLLTIDQLTVWFAGKPHIRDPARVAAAALRRGLSREERAEVVAWLGVSRETPGVVEEGVITDDEREWRLIRAGG